MGVTNQEASVAGQASLTRDLARDLFPGATTPFARTLLAGPAEAALRNAYSELGGTAPAGRFWHFRGAYAYLDSDAVREADRSLCGAAWLGREQPEPPGGLRGRLQAGGVIRRSQARQAGALGEVLGLQTRLLRWWAWVQGLKWTQADQLQVMEELEPHAHAALQTYFLIRMALNATAATFAARLNEWLPGLSPDHTAALTLGVTGLPSVSAAETVLHSARLAHADPERLARMARISHRGPGEMRADALRWGDAPQLLQYLAEQGAPRWTPAAAEAQRRQQLAKVERVLRGNQHRQLSELLDALVGAMRAADIAWDSLTLVMAAAQRWVEVTARETVAVGLIARPADVLYLELEELKQVATGEWHAGDREEVLASVERRMQETPDAPLAQPGPVAVVSPGCNDGPRYCDSPRIQLPPPGAVWSADSADPGCTPFWAFASCVQASGADPWSPGMIAARGLGVPALTSI